MRTQCFAVLPVLELVSAGCGGLGANLPVTSTTGVYNQSDHVAYIAIVKVPGYFVPYTGSLSASEVRFIGPVPRTAANLVPNQNFSDFEIELTDVDPQVYQLFHVNSARTQVFDSTYGAAQPGRLLGNNIVIGADNSISMDVRGPLRRQR